MERQTAPGFSRPGSSPGSATGQLTALEHAASPHWAPSPVGQPGPPPRSRLRDKGGHGHSSQRGAWPAAIEAPHDHQPAGKRRWPVAGARCAPTPEAEPDRARDTAHFAAPSQDSRCQPDRERCRPAALARGQRGPGFPRARRPRLECTGRSGPDVASVGGGDWRGTDSRPFLPDSTSQAGPEQPEWAHGGSRGPQLISPPARRLLALPQAFHFFSRFYFFIGGGESEPEGRRGAWGKRAPH